VQRYVCFLTQKPSKVGLAPSVVRRWDWYEGGNCRADSGVLAALNIFYLLKTCKHTLSCTKYFVCEQEAFNATQAIHGFSKISSSLYKLRPVIRGISEMSWSISRGPEFVLSFLES